MTFKLQTFDSQPDGMGGTTEDWTEYDTVLGYLDLITGSNQQHQAQNAIVEESTHVLITDYRDDIHDRMRVVSAGRVYKITYVDDPVGVNHHLEIYLKFEGDEPK